MMKIWHFKIKLSWLLDGFCSIYVQASRDFFVKEATPNADDCQLPKLKLLLKIHLFIPSSQIHQSNVMILVMPSFTERRTRTSFDSIISLSTWMFPKTGGKPQKWMVYFMENPIEHGMIWGFSHYFCWSPNLLTKTPKQQMQPKSQQRPLLLLRSFLGLRCQLPHFTQVPQGSREVTHHWKTRSQGCGQKRCI